MTTVSMGGGCRLAISPKKAWPQSPPSLPKKTATILLKSSHRVSCRSLWQEILGWKTVLILDQDDAGTLPKTGSIGRVTRALP